MIDHSMHVGVPEGARHDRPRTKGDRLGQVAELAVSRSWKICTLWL